MQHGLERQTPALNFASQATAYAGQSWGPRTIPDNQLFYVRDGTAELRAGGRAWTLRRGQSALLGPACPHRLYACEQTEYYSVHFAWHAESPEPVHPAYGLRDVPASLLEDRLQPQAVRLGDNALELPLCIAIPAVEGLLQRIAHEYSGLSDEAGSAYLLRALTMDLIVRLVRFVHTVQKPSPASADERLRPALQALAGEPDKAWSVAELAQRCGYHPGHFSRLFAAAFGIKPKPYLNRERIRSAKQALLGGESMERIAERMGYSSIHHFSRNFKATTGLTPGEFRQQPGRDTPPSAQRQGRCTPKERMGI
ncbi:AraC family transcriptional regulator [Paenibacillus sp. IB182496]|uniref:AraC family transcriptional regulator n=1 Tax=Paenibacillus sabuli TaxID=2772509 RepID=A0A927GQE8_9BACL|nr:AraC family transcriptional regulator [Paenibacillus sabuli]MBD2844201.1 AraC family transcriptional regulator [Paenibacillus sabuli]